MSSTARLLCVSVLLFSLLQGAFSTHSPSRPLRWNNKPTAEGRLSDPTNAIPVYVTSARLLETQQFTDQCSKHAGIGSVQVAAALHTELNGVTAQGVLRFSWNATGTPTKTPLCSYLIATVFDFYVHVVDFSSSAGESVVQLDLLNGDDDILDVKDNGFRVFLLPDGIIGEIVDVVELYHLMNADYSPEYVSNFLKEHADFDWKKRGASFVNVSDSHFQDGDLIVVQELDGESMLIMYGTGGHNDHTAVLLWIDGVLNVVESCDHGIRRKPFQDWIRGRPPYYHAAVLRLSPEYSRKFNASRALEWFEELEGVPYGWFNFLYGWVDTLGSNYPPPLSAEAVPTFLVLVQQLQPKVADVMYLQGLNLRLGTSGLDVYDIISYLDNHPELNSTLLSLAAIPELDSWKYNFSASSHVRRPHTEEPMGRQSVFEKMAGVSPLHSESGGVRSAPAMVCSAFAMEFYRAAGIFDDASGRCVYDFQGTEFTPKDVYQVALFDPSWNRPDACINADPTLPYCQINGEYVLELPEWNSIPMYDHINERCPTVPPKYDRPAGC